MRRVTCLLLLLTVCLGYFAFSRTVPSSDPIKLLYAFMALSTSISGMIVLAEKRNRTAEVLVSRGPHQSQASAIGSMSATGVQS